MAIKWLAGIIGSIISFFLVASLILSSIAEFGEPVHIEVIILGIFIAAGTAGVVTAWIKEKAGGNRCYSTLHLFLYQRGLQQNICRADFRISFLNLRFIVHY
ncbi:MAG: hypothetical protein U9O59_01365 [Actinomycetota bacterium]|nr:hypothetical protein [Actinomycetota bacterium]